MSKNVFLRFFIKLQSIGQNEYGKTGTQDFYFFEALVIISKRIL